jgi:hypothetical protein
MKFQIASFIALLGVTQAFSVSQNNQPRVYTNDAECSRRQSFANILATTITLATASPVLAREEYLTEPTEEFKESERLREEFRRKQLELKREFNKVLDRLTFESSTEEQLINDLNDLKKLVIYTEGLPLGIKKEELVKIIRAKKAKGNWPTNVEIAYQSLTREIAYQQSPNKDKDVANPL